MIHVLDSTVTLKSNSLRDRNRYGFTTYNALTVKGWGRTLRQAYRSARKGGASARVARNLMWETAFVLSLATTTTTFRTVEVAA